LVEETEYPKTVKVEEDEEEELPIEDQRCCGQKPHKVT
jgi:hypothetical protein